MVDGCKLVVGVMRTLNSPDRVRPLGLMSGAGKPFFHRASKVWCCEKRGVAAQHKGVLCSGVLTAETNPILPARPLDNEWLTNCAL